MLQIMKKIKQHLIFILPNGKKKISCLPFILPSNQKSFQQVLELLTEKYSASSKYFRHGW